jgi:hypothetical protein
MPLLYLTYPPGPPEVVMYQRIDHVQDQFSGCSTEDGMMFTSIHSATRRSLLGIGLRRWFTRLLRELGWPGRNQDRPWRRDPDEPPTLSTSQVRLERNQLSACCVLVA